MTNKSTEKKIVIALAGNPNSGKTTLFNHLTGSVQYVGNWPGVTVERKEGRLTGHAGVLVQDLPGIYSLSPWTAEERVARNFLVHERPDVILNIVDGSNLERNLYLTTQLLELGLPVVVAINMMDIVRRDGGKIDLATLSRRFGCPVVGVSALKGEGADEVATACLAEAHRCVDYVTKARAVFSGGILRTLREIEKVLPTKIPEQERCWWAVKVFERDPDVCGNLSLNAEQREKIEGMIAACERETDDEAVGLIAAQRYDFVQALARETLRKVKTGQSRSDRVDQVMTNRILALPIFALIMTGVYWIAMGPFGSFLTDWTNDTFGAAWMQGGAGAVMDYCGVGGWVKGLVVDGIVGGVGALLGFLPQMIVLFLMLSVLEDVGYMARIAFIMDRLFRRFGLSGKSFIPMLVSAGCGVPGILASRTIESERDRRMTIMTTTFIPCGAKMPIVALVAAALFDGGGWVAASAYFTGVTAIVFTGLLLKKTRLFAGDPAPFVMELPDYHLPYWRNIFNSTKERAASFVRRAGTIILLSSALIWFLSGYGWSAQEGEKSTTFGAVENMDQSVLGRIGSHVAPVFAPMGFGNWQSTVATVMGLVAKEEVVSVFGVLYGVDDEEKEVSAADIVENEDLPEAEKAATLAPIRRAFDESSGGHGRLAAFCFLLFNLLCAPCFAAMGAIRREMNSGRWTAFAIGYQCVFAYLVSLAVYRVGLLFSRGGGAVATILTAAIVFAGLAVAAVCLIRDRLAGKCGCGCTGGCAGCPASRSEDFKNNKQQKEGAR